MTKWLRTLAAAALTVCSATASADVIYTFTAQGVSQGFGQAGIARFDFSSPNALQLTLINTVSPTASVTSLLDGLQFMFGTAPTSIQLTGVSAPSVIDCTNVTGSSCPAASNTPTNFGWGTTFSNGVATLGAGFSNGVIGFRPYDIVNASFNSTVANGLATAAENPLLVGPVTFTFALTGLSAIPQVTSASFYFGAPPPSNLPAISVAEPGSLALMGIAFIAAFFGINRAHRRRQHRAS